MTPERFAALERVCQAALDLPEDRRAAYLDEACAGDPDLRREAESLLAAPSRTGSLLRQPPAVPAAPRLARGDRLGAYEVLDEIGEGGMGVVYRARDTRLGRDVAVKVVGDVAMFDPAAFDRFTREARIVAALNHPHICALHDVGREAGLDFLVMELVDGESLAARLKKGRMRLEQALDVGIQVADALAAAHRQGVIHRDLKPANVMLTKSGAKLLDFGLAKWSDSGRAVAGMSRPATQAGAHSVTAPGVIVGTVQYMPPEQVEGRPVDSRADIWALGALIYEMVAGKPPFEGASAANVMAAILERDPAPLDAIAPPVPAAVNRVIRKCLSKDRDDRWQNARDLADELKWIAAGEHRPADGDHRATRPRRWLRLAFEAALVVSLAVALAVVLGYFRPRPSRLQKIHFPVVPPMSGEFRYWDVPALSPNGDYIVFGFEGANNFGLLWVRRLDSPEAQPLLGGDGTTSNSPVSANHPGSPFWSPDSRQVGFFAEGALWKTDLASRAAHKLCDQPAGFGGSWSRAGIILFAARGGSLYQVREEGGVPKPATTLDASRRETSHEHPWFLPDGRHFLYLARSASPENTGVFVGSLDGMAPRLVLRADSFAMYSPPGYLLFAQGQNLVAQPFDIARFELKGESFPVAEHVALLIGSTSGLRAPIASVSETGVLCYLQEPSAANHLGWFSRVGTLLGTLGDPGDYSNPALSHDERRLAVGLRDAHNGGRDIWVFDVVRRDGHKLTIDPADDLNPVWSPDDRWIAFCSARRGARDVFQTLASGDAGREQLAWASPENKNPEDWAPNGMLLSNVETRGGSVEVWGQPPDRGAARPLLQGAGGRDQSQLSPDGRWIAYRSSASGRSEVFIETFPSSGQRWPISTAGGREPRWGGDGRELFYLEGTTLKAVALKYGPSGLEPGQPTTLFTAPIDPQPLRRNRYVVTRDGQRFLLVTSSSSTPRALQVVVNWTAGQPLPSSR